MVFPCRFFFYGDKKRRAKPSLTFLYPPLNCSLQHVDKYSENTTRKVKDMAQGDLTRINSNIAGLNALNALKAINTKLGIHQLRLSTGKRINEAADDPAGLTIGIKFNARTRGLGVALDNIGDAKNLLAVAEGGLSKISDILLTIRDKVVQAASDALGKSERDAIAGQIKSLLREVSTIASETQWNKQDLLSGMLKPMNFHTGAEKDQKTTIQLGDSRSAAALGISLYNVGLVSGSGFNLAADLDIGTATTTLATYTVEVTRTAEDVYKAVLKEGNNALATAEALTNGAIWITDKGVIDFGDLSNITVNGIATATIEVSGDHYVSDYSKAQQYLEKIDKAIADVSKSMTDIGALVSRLTSKEENLTIARANTEAAYNRIMNADMAAEQLEAMKLSILQQTATAMLAQANVAPQAVLSLFR